jgi:hypothetical protein
MKVLDKLIMHVIKVRFNSALVLCIFSFFFDIDDDVLSINSARSLSSSCSLASQTLERAQQNMNKYWGGHSPASVDSPKKPYSAKH